MEKLRIVKEYDKFYLCEHSKGYKECFNKRDYKATNDGYIVKRKENNYTGGLALSSDKVNRNFNPSVFF